MILGKRKGALATGGSFLSLENVLDPGLARNLVHLKFDIIIQAISSLGLL